MLYQNVFSAIDALDAEFQRVWAEVAAIESPTAYKEGVDAVGAYFIERARARGFQIEIFEQKVSGNVVCITMNPEAKGAPVALSGHMDTVHPVGSFGSPAVRIEDGKIYGPGVTDCKGGAVACLMAMEALDDCDYRERPVMLLLQSDEETGSKGSGKSTIGWMCEKAKDCVAFLNTEPHKPGTVVLTRKGISRYRFYVKGKAVHSSDCAKAELGAVSAIAEAAYKILELEKLKEPHGITCNCGLIEGGTVPNTVPESCSFVADIRFATAEERERAERIVREVAERSYITGSSCRVEQISYRVAMEPSSKNDALFARMNEIFEEVGLPQLERRHSNGGADSADTTSFGIPSIDCLGTAGGRIHSVEEYGILSSLAESAKRLAAITLKI